MKDVMVEIRESLRKKINQKDYTSIEKDKSKEYFYAVGQLISYYISLNKTSKKTHALFNPFLSLKRDEQLKESLTKLFKKYSYAIDIKDNRFRQLCNVVTSYQVDKNTPIDDTYLIAGYISNNLIYEKREEEQ